MNSSRKTGSEMSISVPGRFMWVCGGHKDNGEYFTPSTYATSCRSLFYECSSPSYHNP